MNGINARGALERERVSLNIHERRDRCHCDKEDRHVCALMMNIRVLTLSYLYILINYFALICSL
jgi:hypothetical protein